MRDAFAYHPPYYHFGVEAINYFDLGPQNSRGFRALKVWLALQQVGREGYVQMISDDIRLSRVMYDRVSQSTELEALTQGLSITTFRYVPSDLKREDGNLDIYQFCPGGCAAVVIQFQSMAKDPRAFDCSVHRSRVRAQIRFPILPPLQRGRIH
jgi:glutamate/tyrosine decarboxylase-like PLP-dependent enzyme